MFKIEEINCDLTKSIECEFFDRFVKFVDCNDLNNYCILPENMKNVLDKIKSMEVYEDDIWIISNPKCGTTWVQEMVWLIANDLDFGKARTVNIDERVPFLEKEGLLRPGGQLTLSNFQSVLGLERSRIIKSHLPAFLLPEDATKGKAKIVYVARNPKDTAVSYFHHHVHSEGWKTANLDLFIRAFASDKVHYSPFNDHVLKFWELRKNGNVLFLHFEDMKRNLKSVVHEVSEFFHKSYTSRELDKLCDHLSFENMKANEMVNKSKVIEVARKIHGYEEHWNFMRKGKVGSYKEELNDEQIELLDAYAKRIEGTDFRYKYE